MYSSTLKFNETEHNNEQEPMSQQKESEVTTRKPQNDNSALYRSDTSWSSDDTETGTCRLSTRVRLPEAKPSWVEGTPTGFTRIKLSNEHPHKYRENLVFISSAGGFIDTEVITTLIERG